MGQITNEQFRIHFREFRRALRAEDKVAFNFHYDELAHALEGFLKRHFGRIEPKHREDALQCFRVVLLRALTNFNLGKATVPDLLEAFQRYLGRGLCMCRMAYLGGRSDLKNSPVESKYGFEPVMFLPDIERAVDARRENARPLSEDLIVQDGSFLEPLNPRSLQMHESSPEDIVVREDSIEHFLETLDDPHTRRAVEFVLQGNSLKDANRRLKIEDERYTLTYDALYKRFRALRAKKEVQELLLGGE